MRARLAIVCALVTLVGGCGGAMAPRATGPVVGRAMPTTTFALASGGELPIASTHGNVLLLAFFTTYCPNTPSVLRALDGFRARETAAGLTILAVHLGDDAAAVDDLAAKLGVHVRFAFDTGGATASQLGLETVPSIVLVDRAGTVRHVHAGYHGEDDRTAIDREITALLDEGVELGPPPTPGQEEGTSSAARQRPFGSPLDSLVNATTVVSTFGK